MWVFLNDAMVSIVQDRANSARLVCRARIKGDLQRAFAGRLKGHKVLRTPAADYLYRVTLPRDVVAAAMRAWLESVVYDNFKNSVKDRGRHDAYLRVWSVMNSEQLRREPRARAALSARGPGDYPGEENAAAARAELEYFSDFVDRGRSASRAVDAILAAHVEASK